MGSTFTGGDAAAKVLKKLPGKVRGKVMLNATRQGATVIRRQARNNVKRYKRTGTLHKSIAAVRRRRGVPAGSIVIEIGARGDGFYGSFLEFGTRNQPARPWLRPAFDVAVPVALAKIRQALGKQILKEALKLSGQFRASGLGARRRRR